MGSIAWGVLHGWSMANPWSGSAVWSLQLIAMAWLVRRLSQSATPWAACQSSALFAIAWFASSLWWLSISMHEYGGLHAVVTALAVLALCCLLASFYAGVGVAFVWLKSPKNTSPLQDAALFAALWLLAELARGTVLTGLPWNAIGYAHIDSPLVGAAPWVGVYGLSALAAFIAALFVLTQSCLLKIGIVLLLCVKTLLAPSPQANLDKPLQANAPQSLTVRLLQGNIPQNEKFDSTTGVGTALAWYKTELLRAVDDKVDLVVAPETALPLLPQQLPTGYWPSLSDALTGSAQTAALTGIPLGSMVDGYTNSVIGWRALSSQPYRYDKHHLVPFGEFIPPTFRWFTNLMRIPLGDFNRGDLNQPSFAHAGERFAINICYEDLFGEELAQRFIDPSLAPTVFVNVSNMGWFGSGMAIDQHLNISRMRAIEFNRPMLRATNTGATVIINHRGQVTHSLERTTRGTLTGTVEGQSKLTPYANWASRYGLQPLWAMACAWVALVWLIKRQSRRP
ncbi:MAG: apolipoprotein N-acyltransferase [Cytophagales bacterium]|nr:apolipoprotein N-acyltransferase [Cytophagales bacterium]